MTAYLITNRPRQRQFRARGRKPTGLIVVHTAESAPDEKGPDDGTLSVARFIRDRSTFGSYHWLADSDSRLLVVPLDQQAYGDGTGSNPYAVHISVATQAHRWPTVSKAWRDGAVKQLAAAAAESAKWLKKEHGITVPARRVSRSESSAGKAGFISHGERDPGRRTDPGKDFPWAAFLAEYGRLMKPPAPPKPAPPKTFRIGERVLKVTNPRTSGSDVLWVQSREFFRLKRDGVYGVKTRAAVRRFQVRHNARVWRALGKKVHGHGLIEAKGVVGPRTWDLLQQATTRFKK